MQFFSDFLYKGYKVYIVGGRLNCNDKYLQHMPPYYNLPKIWTSTCYY